MRKTGRDTLLVHQMSEEEWYQQNGCEHAHCPYDCDHPQPIMDGEKLICASCLHASQGKAFVEMIPCTPDVCN